MVEGITFLRAHRKACIGIALAGIALVVGGVLWQGRVRPSSTEGPQVVPPSRRLTQDEVDQVLRTVGIGSGVQVKHLTTWLRAANWRYSLTARVRFRTVGTVFPTIVSDDPEPQPDSVTESLVRSRLLADQESGSDFVAELRAAGVDMGSTGAASRNSPARMRSWHMSDGFLLWVEVATPNGPILYIRREGERAPWDQEGPDPTHGGLHLHRCWASREENR